VSQQRFNDASIFLKAALDEERLGRLLQCDAYVKWYRPPSYYARAFKGTWQTEGGGALINQAIHQVDLLRWFAGPLARVYGRWRLGAVHRIESEDIVNATLEFASGALGVIQASTALWPGYPERVEIHGEKGSAIITGDRLSRWDVQGEAPAAVSDSASSGASDPMAISLAPFERQFRDLIEAHQAGRQPLVSAQDGINALEIVESIYESCRTGQPVEWA
jgi:predicted dehydrogenase